MILSNEPELFFARSWLVGWVLWHVNHCRLFNAKSFLYIYIEYIYDL